MNEMYPENSIFLRRMVSPGRRLKEVTTPTPVFTNIENSSNKCLLDFYREQILNPFHLWCTLRHEPNVPENFMFLRRMVWLVRRLKNLIRLPEPTKEGYKVLMYTIKDPDYTKLVFSDAVKGFCMYNDCILSEDGLAEGYIVLFDMKGVSLGHLARVSLPALKAFMCYIQEAHPARLKAVHVLNTANYINHVMRLITPLVRSELLSLVKFHKGIVPDGMDPRILPKDYGGEAPDTAVLDAETRSLIEKYADWLLDTERYRVDESKRVKKASWWGFFAGTNPSSVTQAPGSPASIEKQKQMFLENLQID